MGTYNINERRFYNVKKQDKKIYWYFNNGVFFSYTYWLCYKCKHNRSCTTATT